MLYSLGIKDASTTSCNPAANSIMERVHKTARDILHSYIYSNNQTHTLSDTIKVADIALAIASYAI